MQDDLIQHTHAGIAEDRARFVILDDQLDELAVKREQLARELATVEEPAEDSQGSRS